MKTTRGQSERRKARRSPIGTAKEHAQRSCGPFLVLSVQRLRVLTYRPARISTLPGVQDVAVHYFMAFSGHRWLQWERAMALDELQGGREAMPEGGLQRRERPRVPGIRAPRYSAENRCNGLIHRSYLTAADVSEVRGLQGRALGCTTAARGQHREPTQACILGEGRLSAQKRGTDEGSSDAWFCVGKRHGRWASPPHALPELYRKSDGVFAASTMASSKWLAKLHPDVRSFQPLYQEGKSRMAHLSPDGAVHVTEVRCRQARVCGRSNATGVFAWQPHQGRGEVARQGGNKGVNPLTWNLASTDEDCSMPDWG